LKYIRLSVIAINFESLRILLGIGSIFFINVFLEAGWKSLGFALAITLMPVAIALTDEKNNMRKNEGEL
jgi:hypothetical protein